MLSTSNLSATQAENYYIKDDYYTQENSQQVSRWYGQGARTLGLAGVVEKTTFADLLAGVAPDGQTLSGKRVDARQHRAATDYTFSAPKSVSIAALIQQDTRVLEAHHQAMNRALSVLESRYAQTRISTSTGRQRICTGNLIAAVFTHATNREVEPQLHSHCVVINATQLPNGCWYSFSNEAAIANQKLLGQIYQNELAIALRQLGYEIQLRPHGQFDLVGYSSELLQLFSTRRQQITKLLAAWDAEGTQILDANGQEILTGIARREAANLRSRKRKPKAMHPERLWRGWNALIHLKGLELPAIPTVDWQVNTQVAELPETVVQKAIQHCSERESVFKRSQIERFVFEHHLGEQRFEVLQEAIAHSEKLIQVDDGKYTTQAALNLELNTIRLMQSGKGQMGKISSLEQVNALLENESLTVGQQEAIQLASTTNDQFIAWQGVAGSGKTFALEVFRGLAEAQGYRVRGFAPSAEAAHGLGKMLQIEAETVAGLLVACGQVSPFVDDRPQEIWIVDEAGLLSMKDAHDLLSRARAENARAILVGDTKQLSAVEAGNPFKSLQAGGMATARLDEMLRQQTQELKTAVKWVAQGKVVEGIQALAAAGCIQEIPNKQERFSGGDATRIQQMVKDYLRLSAEERQQTLLLAGTNQARWELTQKIRQGLQAEGSLGQDVFTVSRLRQKDLTLAQVANASAYEPGDIVVPTQDYKKRGLVKNQQYRVLASNCATNQLSLETPQGQAIAVDPAKCEKKTVYQVQQLSVAEGDCLRWTKNNRAVGIRNGQTFTVQRIASDGMAQILDQDGNTRQVNLSGNQYVDYAWVSTTYSSQGKTGDRLMALMDGMTINRESFYVTVSRARQQLMLYTADIAELTQRAQKSMANENVSDYIPLFQVYQYAQTPKVETQSRSATAEHRDLAKRIGDCVGERIRQKLAATFSRGHSIEATGEQLGAGSARAAPELDRDVAPLSAAIAGYLEQRELLECTGEFAAAVAAVDCSFECLERATESRTRLAAAVTRLDAAIARQIGGVESGEPSNSTHSRQCPTELMEVEAKENLQFSTPVRLSTHVEAHSLLPASSVKQRYQELWQQYSQGVQASNLVKLDYQVGRRGFEAGLSQKEIARMLIAGSAYVQQLEQEQAREKAREYVNQTAHAVCQQEQEKQVRRERSPQLEL